MLNFLSFVGMTAEFFWRSYMGLQRAESNGALPRAMFAVCVMLLDRMRTTCRYAVLRARMQRNFMMRGSLYGA